MYQIVRGAAEEKGVNVQELLRAVVIPEWLRANNANRASRVALSMELLDHDSHRRQVQSELEKQQTLQSFPGTSFAEGWEVHSPGPYHANQRGTSRKLAGSSRKR